MSGNKQITQPFAKKWDEFINSQRLNETQSDQFAKYMHMLQMYSDMINLTTITDPKNILAYHFRDSLQLRYFIDMNKVYSLCDIGTGGGFPGIPLKIVFPHVQLTLIEVNKKKIHFLQQIINELELDACYICPLDWRTFLRKTNEKIDLFCARASLQPEELIRMFKSSSPYKRAKLVYWASSTWHLNPRVEPFVKAEWPYRINKRNLKLILFSYLEA